MNVFSSYEAAYWLERISYNFPICSKEIRVFVYPEVTAVVPILIAAILLNILLGNGAKVRKELEDL